MVPVLHQLTPTHGSDSRQVAKQPPVTFQDTHACHGPERANQSSSDPGTRSRQQHVSSGLARAHAFVNGKMQHMHFFLLHMHKKRPMILGTYSVFAFVQEKRRLKIKK